MLRLEIKHDPLSYFMNDHNSQRQYPCFMFYSRLLTMRFSQTTILSIQGDLWFGNEDLMTPDGTAKFDRLGYLKITLFTLLCDENYKIEYTDFLLLFASDPEPGNG